ncbi:hypothetical protein GQ53DRAFT_751845 [Thozetella sp. PMI_491]|nr:hypothetical protein GQ53DRAFT_751845 [Thozetella sp. PMI_491]
MPYCCICRQVLAHVKPPFCLPLTKSTRLLTEVTTGGAVTWGCHTHSTRIVGKRRSHPPKASCSLSTPLGSFPLLSTATCLHWVELARLSLGQAARATGTCCQSAGRSQICPSGHMGGKTPIQPKEAIAPWELSLRIRSSAVSQQQSLGKFAQSHRGDS